MRHIVWDWNGTLLDDIEIVVESVNVSLALYGAEPIDADGYRSHYTRPVKVFYERLFGRDVADHEWHHLDAVFHESYVARVESVKLAADAVAAIGLARDLGAAQSLLSMAPHDHLVPTVDRMGLTASFVAVTGSPGPSGAHKDVHLMAHLRALEVDPRYVVLIGDTPDDVAAARHVGASAVLYDGGSHHRHDLEAVGAPVASSLIEAVQLAMG